MGFTLRFSLHPKPLHLEFAAIRSEEVNLSKKRNTYYWQMQFYFCMAIATTFSSVYLQDFSWLLLAVGSACLGLSNRIHFLSKNADNGETQQQKAGVYSRIGFLVIAAALLVNALTG